jgi:hypothetical protein
MPEEDEKSASERVAAALKNALGGLLTNPAQKLTDDGVALITAKCTKALPDSPVFQETDCCTMVGEIEMIVEDQQGRPLQIKSLGAAGVCADLDNEGGITKLTIRRRLQKGDSVQDKTPLRATLL